jgi:phage-related protein
MVMLQIFKKQFLKTIVATLALGSWPRWRLAKVQAKNEAWELHFMLPGSARECEGMNPHIPKWAPTLGVGVSMDSRIFRRRLQGQNSLDWKIPYNIENILEPRCLKWACMIHFDT